ncbi:hypothetical protein BDW68DRAFT_155926 [Aspergillus falconensis]
MSIILHELHVTYHIQFPVDQTLIFDPRTQPLNYPVLRGRCEIALLTARPSRQNNPTSDGVRKQHRQYS